MKVSIVCLAVFLTVSFVDSSSPDAINQIIPGGLGGISEPTTEIHQMIRELHPKITTFLAGIPGADNIRGSVRPVSYKTQLVNGVNYFVKVKGKTMRKNVYYHLRIYKGFDGVTKLIKVEGPKGKSDPINYF